MIPRPLLEVRDLCVDMAPHATPVISDVRFTIAGGEALGVVGESGAGKSLLLRALLGLLPARFSVTRGSALLDGQDLLALDRRRRRAARGRAIGFVPQEPLTALNPVYAVGRQIDETVAAVTTLRGRAVRARTLDLLAQVGLSPAERVARSYPHELSGGMRQRVMIAIALSGEPSLLLCDEPTTALDATVQARLLDLIAGLARDRGIGVILVTHDVGVAARSCQRIAVMYAGRIVEEGPIADVLAAPAHPYTTGLLSAVPIGDDLDALAAIPGSPPDLGVRPSGCAFHPRCPVARPECSRSEPPWIALDAGRGAECLLLARSEQGTAPEPTQHHVSSRPHA